MGVVKVCLLLLHPHLAFDCPFRSCPVLLETQHDHPPLLLLHHVREGRLFFAGPRNWSGATGFRFLLRGVPLQNFSDLKPRNLENVLVRSGIAGWKDFVASLLHFLQRSLSAFFGQPQETKTCWSSYSRVRMCNEWGDRKRCVPPRGKNGLWHGREWKPRAQGAFTCCMWAIRNSAWCYRLGFVMREKWELDGC